jgi:hypothetical protein
MGYRSSFATKYSASISTRLESLAREQTDAALAPAMRLLFIAAITISLTFVWTEQSLGIGDDIEFACREYLQDGEVAETPQQQADYDRCLERARQRGAAHAEGPFQPWQAIWQCNDVRVTITSRSPVEIEYDLGGMIWGGSRITVVHGNLFFNGWPCVPLRPVGY